MLVSRPTFPLVSKNRWEKRQFDSRQLSDLFKVIQLIQAAVGNPHECTEDDKVRNTKFFHKRYRNLAASLPCESYSKSTTFAADVCLGDYGIYRKGNVSV